MSSFYKVSQLIENIKFFDFQKIIEKLFTHFVYLGTDNSAFFDVAQYSDFAQINEKFTNEELYNKLAPILNLYGRYYTVPTKILAHIDAITDIKTLEIIIFKVIEALSDRVDLTNIFCQITNYTARKAICNFLLSNISDVYCADYKLDRFIDSYIDIPKIKQFILSWQKSFDKWKENVKIMERSREPSYVIIRDIKELHNLFIGNIFNQIDIVLNDIMPKPVSVKNLSLQILNDVLDIYLS